MHEDDPSGQVKFLDRNPPDFPEAEARRIALELYGLEGEFTPLESERDANFHIQTQKRGGFVLKIANAGDQAADIDFETQALRYIQRQDANFPVPRVVPTRKGEAFTTVAGPEGAQHWVHALSYLPGTPFAEAAQTPALWRSLGAAIARLDLALRGFFHPQARRYILWDLTRCSDLRPHTAHIADAAARRNVESILGHMGETVLPRLASMRHQVIHADANPDNALADPGGSPTVAGMIDFGDMVYAPLVTEPAIAADLQCMLTERGLDNLCGLVAGYDGVLPLEADEIDLLYDLLLARRAATAVIIAWRKANTPDQSPYLLDREQLTWDAIDNFRSLGRAAVSQRLRDACRFPAYSAQEGGEASPDEAEALLARRRRALGKHLSLFYSQPLHFERGRGPWLYTPQGEAFLDAYNNVPVVGHGHPHVVRAISRQAAALNTNTRYLYRVILDYAERLAGLLPGDLSVCAFVNSGSEADDIAWRMAQFVTGAGGALVMEHAYHGITQVTADLSSSEWRRQPPRHVRTLLVPDSYRGLHRRGEPDLAQRYAADADRAIAELAEEDLKPTAFVVDTALVSCGIPEVPEGYLAAVVEKVRAAGGFFIADEVQAGFGRCSPHLWGFEAHGVIPDIVTMGKPVGNGFPLGVIATRPEILDAFVAETELFSTFGGNPVACAAGMAVLDVIEREGLLARAQQTGDYLRQGLRALMDRHAWIGDVRGVGLLVGVELVRDRDTREPAAEQAARVLDLMREQRVLIGRTGPHANVLKIRPPLVFESKHADLLIGALDTSLAKL
ncbi:MAG: aminotransferase class III-fold pyridoxal phosphate-dependent enzyme [Anaerolineales bacterium]|jgi:4-aminobutyrate aminotransferase-like enzyme/Ser/Thr protein kinase RdoA (MazF antagonist)